MKAQKYPCGTPLVNLSFIAWNLTSYYTWQQFCISEKKSYMNNIFSAVWGQKENFHFYSQAICCHGCWRCRNNTGVGAKNKTAVYLPLLEPKKWYAQRSGAAVCFSECCHSSLYLIFSLSPSSSSTPHMPLLFFETASVWFLPVWLHFVWHRIMFGCCYSSLRL